MAATFNWNKTIGDSGSPTAADLGATGNLFNFMDADSNTPADYATYPITAGNNSFEVWLRAHFSGMVGTIQNLQFWKSTSFNPNTGLAIKYKANGQTSYVTPVKTSSSIATTSIPTSDPATANVSIGGALDGTLTDAGYSDYIVLQLQTTTAASAGDTSLAEFSLQYDES